MKHCAIVVGLVALMAGVVSAQSLGEVARAEQARRKAVKAPGKVYTNGSLRGQPTPPSPAPAAAGSQPTPAPSAGTSPTPSASPPTSSAPPQGGAAASEAPKDEASWRKRMESARTALSRAQAFQAALQSQINGLTADFTARDNPIERNAIEADRRKALAELERVKQEIVTTEKSIVDIQEEARRAGVPAGWVR